MSRISKQDVTKSCYTCLFNVKFMITHSKFHKRFSIRIFSCIIAHQLVVCKCSTTKVGVDLAPTESKFGLWTQQSAEGSKQSPPDYYKSVLNNSDSVMVPLILLYSSTGNFPCTFTMELTKCELKTNYIKLNHWIKQFKASWYMSHYIML